MYTTSYNTVHTHMYMHTDMCIHGDLIHIYAHAAAGVDK